MIKNLTLWQSIKKVGFDFINVGNYCISIYDMSGK